MDDGPPTIKRKKKFYGGFVVFLKFSHIFQKNYKSHTKFIFYFYLDHNPNKNKKTIYEGFVVFLKFSHYFQKNNKSHVQFLFVFNWTAIQIIILKKYVGFVVFLKIVT